MRRVGKSAGGEVIPLRTTAVTFSLSSVVDHHQSSSLMKNNKKPRQPLLRPPPVRRVKKPNSKPKISEVTPGPYVISDSQIKELLKIRLNSPVPDIPIIQTFSGSNPQSNVSIPRKVNSCSSIPQPVNFTTTSVHKENTEDTMSLLEQKRQQWAKEREELHGLWSPWGKTNNANTLDPKSSSPYSNNNGDNHPTASGATVVAASYVSGLGLSSKAYPHSDVYLPPISGAEQPGPGANGRRSTATTTTTSWAITATSNNNMGSQDILRKSSLPNKMQSSLSSSQNLRRESHPVGGGGGHQPYHHQPNITEETPWRMRRGSVDNDNNYPPYQHPQEEPNNNRRYLGDTEDYNIMMERGSGRSPGRVIVHKIYMEGGDSRENDERMSTSLMEPSMMSPTVGPGGDSNMAQMKHREFGGSMGYIGLGKPPAPAMRSSLTIGLDPSYAQSLEIIEKQEKEKWLAELEQQREEQRIRKMMEKDDKRARWGDRGIGVGHFWEPSDSADSRLPANSPHNQNTQNHLQDPDDMINVLSPSPPPWLGRSLERMVTSKSLTNVNGDENTGDIEPYIGGPGATNHFINHSSSDLRHIDEHGDDVNDGKTFARGHNTLLDPDIKSEMEKKRQANQEHLDALKKQMEEKKQKQEAEKRKQLQEERNHEERIAKQAELELKRLEQEKRRKNGWTSDVEADQSTSRLLLTTNDSMTEDADEDVPKHESPLIPHAVEQALPDAYELEIARRQSLLVGQKPSFTSTDESSVKLNGAMSMLELREEAKMIDQCLMTDSDHMYERTLTPTTERKRSSSLGRSEFGTQTELEDVSNGEGRSKRGTRKSRAEKVDEGKQKEEKPRWGANPVKKQYLKQSEKDPYYMQRLRKRNQRTSQGDSTGTDDTEETHSGYQRSTQSHSQGSSIPFSRIRQRKLSKSPVKNSMGPLKAVHGGKKTEEVKTQHSDMKMVSAHRSLPRSFPSDPQLSSGTPGKRSQKSSALNGIVRQSLGSISGLNSVGGSEGTGSGYTSPSIGPRNSLGSGGSDSLRSGSINSPAMGEYIPAFSKEFIPMREFDEMPINAGNIAPGFRRTFGLMDDTETSKGSKTSAATTKGRVSSSVTNRSASTFTRKETKINVRRTSSKTSKESEELHEEIFGGGRPESPPVPALMKKMQMGFHPDETGRLSSLPTLFPQVLSPLPPIKIGTPIPTRTPSISDMRIHSSAPKLDIDIAVTSSSNVDLQRLLQTVREQEQMSREATATTAEFSDTPEEDEEQEEDLSSPEYDQPTEHDYHPENGYQSSHYEQLETEDQPEDGDDQPEENIDQPERFKLPGILPDPFPPLEILSSRTLDSEMSFKLQEEFINNLMSQREVQEQLTAREKELCDKGIIEFNVRLPSRWAHRKNPLRCHSSSKILDDYKDPLASERRRATASWLRNVDDASATESILSNLAALKQLST